MCIRDRSSCSLFGGNSGSGLIASSYLSEDADITGAESAYAAMEAELQDMLDNIESEYPGYDEYRVNADEIEHDPVSYTHLQFFNGCIAPDFFDEGADFIFLFVRVAHHQQ